MDNKPNVMNQVWENKDKRAMKGMIPSYVKDLIIANKAEVRDIEALSERMFKWAW